MPSVRLPSNEMFPVAFKLPVIFQLLLILTVPLPFGRNSILVSVVVVLIVLKSIFKSSVAIAVAEILLAALKLINPSPPSASIRLVSIVKFAILLYVETKFYDASTDGIVSASVAASLLIPILELLTSIWSSAVEPLVFLKFRFTP